MSKRITTEEFIEKAKAIHGDKYDYSKTTYIKKKDKVCIICPIHGEFWQTPDSHLNGLGCRKCGIEKVNKSRKKTTEEFVEKAKHVHRNEYDYSDTVYRGIHNKVSIICKIHGKFEQEAAAHLSGQGCPICGRIKASSSIRKTKDSFIEEAKKANDNKYNYSKVKYINSNTKVCVVCPTHGEFWIYPKHHLNGCGCQKCSWEKNAEKAKLTTKEFIEKAKAIHGEKFDYSKVEYKKSNQKVCIICPIHGEFWQTPNDHLSGKGCSKCNYSRLEREISNLLDINNIEFIPQKHFKWLGKKSLDFYLPNENIVIECQGLQHFQSVKHFGGDEYTKIIMEHDVAKKKLCEDHGVTVIYYSDLKIDYPYDVITNKENLVKIIKKS